MRIGSLFSGIGGLELGLERAGCGSVVWQVERDPFCRSVLAKHWPSAVRFDDVCAVGLDNLPPVDIICGGFPCQDLSYAGKGAGLAGERSGLWREYARIVRELRPRFVVVENVSALLARGLGDVLGDLAALGYDAEWHCVRASDVGAPHRRERLFVVAYCNGGRSQGERSRGLLDGERAARGGHVDRCGGETLAHCASSGLQGGRLRGRSTGGSGAANVAHPISCESERSGEPGDVAGEARGAQGEGDERQRVRNAARGGGEAVADASILLGGGGNHHGSGCRGGAGPLPKPGNDHGDRRTESNWTEPQPLLGLAAHGLSGRVARWPAGPGEAQHLWEAPRTIGKTDNRAARLKALGNAVVPQVAEVIGGIVMRIARGRPA